MEEDPEIVEALRLMREAISKRRGYADYYEWPLDRGVGELGVAQELNAALTAAGRPLATSIASRGPGQDPPDCEGVDPNGNRLAIEVTELVDPEAIKAAKTRNAFVWAPWTREKLLEAIGTRLSKKDSRTLLGGPYSEYIVVLHTDEPELGIQRVRTLLMDAQFAVAKIHRAYLLLSYDPKFRVPPFVELALCHR